MGVSRNQIDITFKVANLFVGVLLVVIGVLQVLGSGGDFRTVVIGAYGCFFGATLCLAETGVALFVIEYCRFLDNLLGRGLFYVFVGVLLLQQNPLHMLVLSIMTIIIGFVYVIAYAIPSARPTRSI